MNTYTVSILYPAPLIGGRVITVHAESKSSAVRAALVGQPRGSTGVARLVDSSSYSVDFVDSVRGFEVVHSGFGALL